MNVGDIFIRTEHLCNVCIVAVREIKSPCILEEISCLIVIVKWRCENRLARGQEGTYCGQVGGGGPVASPTSGVSHRWARSQANHMAELESPSVESHWPNNTVLQRKFTCYFIWQINGQLGLPNYLIHLREETAWYLIAIFSCIPVTLRGKKS